MKAAYSTAQRSVRTLQSATLTADIIKGDAQNDKAKLEALVHKHGGEFSQAQLSDLSALVVAPDQKSTSVCVAGGWLTSDVLVRAQIKKGVSVIKPDWIYESIDRARQLPLIKE